MPTPRNAFTATGVGSLLYVLGGYDGADPMPNVMSYDPAADTWRECEPLTTPRDSLTCSTAGGESRDESSSDRMYRVCVMETK